MMNDGLSLINRLSEVVQGQMFLAGNYSGWFAISNGKFYWFIW